MIIGPDLMLITNFYHNFSRFNLNNFPLNSWIFSSKSLPTSEAPTLSWEKLSSLHPVFSWPWAPTATLKPQVLNSKSLGGRNSSNSPFTHWLSKNTSILLGTKKISENGCIEEVIFENDFFSQSHRPSPSQKCMSRPTYIEWRTGVWVCRSSFGQRGGWQIKPTRTHCEQRFHPLLNERTWP